RMPLGIAGVPPGTINCAHLTCLSAVAAYVQLAAANGYCVDLGRRPAHTIAQGIPLPIRRAPTSNVVDKQPASVSEPAAHVHIAAADSYRVDCTVYAVV